KSPHFFRTIAPDDTQGKLAVTFVTSNLKAKKIAVIHDKGAYGKGFADYAVAAIESIPGAKVVLYEGITKGALNYSAVVQKMRREGAEAVIFGGYHPEASKLVAQMKKKRVKIPFIGPDGIKGNGFLDIAGKKAEGVYATGPRDVSRQRLNKQAHDAYRQKFGKEPGTFFDQGYAALQAVFNAANVAGSTDLSAMSKVLREKPVETTLGAIHFDAHGDAIGVGFSVYQVRKGSFVELMGE
ncbi:MAG: branched chain amino acid ABC transporter substrate-binding protein, partial [Desulfuromonas sp.]